MPTKQQKDPSLTNVTRAELAEALEPYPTIQGTCNFVNKVVPGMMLDLLESEAFRQKVIETVTAYATERSAASGRSPGLIVLPESSL